MKIKVKTSFRLIMLIYILLPSITMIFAGIGCFLRFAENTISDETADMAEAYAFTLDNLFEYYADLTDAAAANNLILLTASGELSAVRPQFEQQYDNFISNDPYILDLVIMDKNGGIVYDRASSTHGTIFFGFSDELLTSAKSSVSFSRIFPDNEKYADSIFLVQKHILRDDEQDAGFVSLVVSTSALSDTISAMNFFDDGHIAVFDNSGCAINYYNDSQITRYENINSSVLLNALSDATEDLSDKRINNSGTLPVLKNKGLYCAYSLIGSTGWGYAAITEMTEFQENINNICFMSVIVISLSAVCLIVICIVFTKFSFAPIKDIIKNAEELKAGKTDSRIALKNIKGEFANIAETINDLVDKSLLSEGLNSAVSALSDNMLFEWDYRKNKMYVSPNFVEKFDIDIKNANLENGLFIEKLMDEQTAAQYKNQLAAMIRGKSTLRGEYRMKTRKGSEIWIKVKAMVVSGRLSEPLRVVGILTDIDNEKKHSMQLSKRASYDFLSDLYNRNAFGHELERELASIINGEKLALIFIDIDNFKNYNDKYSHAVGDEVIKFVADVLKNTIAGKGFAGRFGGDEFVVCLTGMREATAALTVKKIAETILENLREGFSILNENTNQQETLHITASMGIVFAPDHGTTPKDLTADADKAMYQVKKNGKAGFIVYRAEE